jgi:stage II sporulation protein AA (anti-sigma F factor antagonist)
MGVESRMLIEVESRQAVCFLRLKGRFHTGADTAYLFARCDEVTAVGGAKVCVDFAEVPYLDSTGVSFLVRLYTRVVNNGGQVVLLRLVPRVQDVLDLTGISALLPSFPDERTALAALGTGAAGG